MSDWVKYARQSFLDEMVRRDGLGESDSPGSCQDCQASPAKIRCMDCSGSVLLCESCTVSSHKRNPLHRIEVRNL